MMMVVEEGIVHWVILDFLFELCFDIVIRIYVLISTKINEIFRRNED